MLEFVGGVTSLGRHRVTGQVRATLDGQLQAIHTVLRFETAGLLAPSKMQAFDDGFFHFAFDLPDQISGLTWEQFLDEYRDVVAYRLVGDTIEQWVVPLHKTALAGMDNRTALQVGRVAEYKIRRDNCRRIAAFTIVYNEHTILPLWIRYYGSQFGVENLYVIDHGSDQPYQHIPEGVTIIKVPRDEFDNWLICRIVAFFQRFLLESYDSVLYCDSDEFVCASPDVLAGRSLSQFLLELDEPIGRTLSYNLHHDILTEPAYDAGRPVLSQRRVIERAPGMDKPLISRVPLSWIPGFHQATEGGVPIAGLFMLHFRSFDLDASLVKGGHYRNSRWNPFDIAAGLAFYQRDDEPKIVLDFQTRSQSFAGLRDTAFDPDATFTVVPQWMCEAIFV